jgi:hypothetical protein
MEDLLMTTRKQNGKCGCTLGVILVLMGCGGCDKASALVSFSGGTCKKEATDSIPGAAFSLSEQYGGLACVTWAATAPDVTKIDLFNIAEACIAEWKGDASIDRDGTVELRLLNPTCGSAQCGLCLFDWSFEVSKVPQNEELRLRIVTDIWTGCGDEADDVGHEPTIYDASLPQGSALSGVRCRFASYDGLAQQADALGTCGSLFMPCRTAEGPAFCTEPSATPCDDGLVCAAGDAADQVLCLLSCGTDGDCPWGDALSCQDGLCRPAAPW